MGWKNLSLNLTLIKNNKIQLDRNTEQNPDEMFNIIKNFRPKRCHKCAQLFHTFQNYERHHCWPIPATPSWKIIQTHLKNLIN
jgi:hypothetical protein